MKRIFVLYVVLSICAAAFSQIKFPEIKWKSDSLIFIREKEALRYGVETFGDGLYVDSLIHYLYLQPIITQYFIDNKSEIWLLFLIAHSKR